MDNTRHKAEITSNWFLEHEFRLAKLPPPTPNFNLIERLCNVGHIIDVNLTNLQQLRNTIMPIWATMSEKCYYNFAESMSCRIKAVIVGCGSGSKVK